MTKKITELLELLEEENYSILPFIEFHMDGSGMIMDFGDEVVCRWDDVEAN